MAPLNRVFWESKNERIHHIDSRQGHNALRFRFVRNGFQGILKNRLHNGLPEPFGNWNRRSTFGHPVKSQFEQTRHRLLINGSGSAFFYVILSRQC